MGKIRLGTAMAFLIAMLIALISLLYSTALYFNPLTSSCGDFLGIQNQHGIISNMNSELELVRPLGDTEHVFT